MTTLVDRRQVFIFVTLIALLSASYLYSKADQTKSLSKYQVVSFEGKTMGTTYKISLSSTEPINFIQAKKEVDSLLLTLNKQMSHYMDDSVITKFNEFNSKKEFLVPSDFFHVLQVSKEEKKKKYSC